MGLIGMMARTAVVAGTATAVSNRVSRRQVNRWNSKAAEQAQQQEPVQQQAPPQQYPQAPAPAPSQPADAAPDLLDQLKQLSVLKNQGVLSEDEFTAAKAKLLGTD